MNFQGLQNEDSIPVYSRLAMLRLSSAADAIVGEFSGDQPPLQQCHSCGSVNKQPHFSPETATAAAAVTEDKPDPSSEKSTVYSSDGATTTKVKRYSNCRFSSSLEEPFPKRTATVLPPISTAPAAGEPNGKKTHRGLQPLISTDAAGDTNGNNNNNFQGFIKIPLQNNQESPVTPSPSPSPAKPPLAPQFTRPLNRTFSDPTGSASYTRKSPTPTHRTLARTASWSPNEVNFNNGESPTTMKSPNHRALTRTASWSPNAQELGGSVKNGESPTEMRLKRMKDGMREMRQWCDLMIQEGAQEETEPEGNKILKDDEAETGGEALCEEAVWVERMGSCLILHFKCPCSKGYQILLCGNNCYYKLTNF